LQQDGLEMLDQTPRAFRFQREGRTGRGATMQMGREQESRLVFRQTDHIDKNASDGIVRAVGVQSSFAVHDDLPFGRELPRATVVPEQERVFRSNMARKLKTFVTSVGFFDLAVAAPSMKAALDAWGFRHNAFQQGFASQTKDAAIIAATTAKPGAVLRRPVGTHEPFQENAELPKGFAIPNIGKADRQAKRPARAAPPPKKPPHVDENQSRAAVISFQKEKAKRDRQRAREEADAKRARAKRERATRKAKAALEAAESRHQEELRKLEHKRDLLEREIEQAREGWEKRRDRMQAALDRAREKV
jgi:hypothetical protein